MTAGSGRSVVDAHVHLWDPATRAYPWMAGLPGLARRFTVDDLRAAVAGTGVGRVVLVQAAADESETRELLRAAAAAPDLVAGVVGWVDLTAPDVAERVARLRGPVPTPADGPGPAATSRAGGRLPPPPLVGLRHQVEDEPAGWLDRADVRRGLRAVAAAGLTYDLLVRPDQLASAAAAVDAVPEGRYVLDHGAKPPTDPDAWAAWRAGVAALAERPGVSVKLSGLLAPAGDPDGAASARARVERAVAHARLLLDLFGPERAMAGSDWPVSTLAGGYDRALAVAHHATADLAPADRALVLGGTATRVYGLTPRDAAPGRT